MILAGCCPDDLHTDTTVAMIPLGGLPVHFARLSVPTPLELTPSKAPVGSRVILNRQGFLSSSVGQLTTMNAARNLDSAGVLAIPRVPARNESSMARTNSIVSFANRDGNSSEQLAVEIALSGPTQLSGGD